MPLHFIIRTTMEDKTSSLVTTLLIDSFIFFVCFLGFVGIRKFRSKRVNLKSAHYQARNAVYSENDFGFFELLEKVWDTSLPEIYKYCGLEAYIYILLHIQITVVLGIMCFFGLFVLIPVYVKGHGQVPNNLEKAGISHVIYEEDFIPTVIVFCVFFSLLSYSLVYLLVNQMHDRPFLAVVEQSTTPVHLYTVEIKGIPKRMPASRALELLEEKLSSMRTMVSSVYVVPDYTDSYKALLKLKQTRKKLEYFKDYISCRNVRPKIRVKYLTEQVDAISYYSSKMYNYNEDYLETLYIGTKANAGIAYVICKTPQFAERLGSLIQVGNDSLRSFLWIVRPAPAPEEIKWEHLKMNHLLSRGKKVCFTMLFIVFFFIFLTPTAFSNMFNTILQDLRVSSFLEGFLSTYVPTIIMLLYQSFILKYTIAYLVSKEKHTSTSSETLSHLIKYIVFMGFYLFIYQVVGMQAIEIVKLLIKGDFGKWDEQLAKTLLFSGEFYTVFLINQIFITTGFDLLQLRTTLLTKINLAMAVTDNEKELAYEVEPFKFGYELASGLTTFMIILCLSVIYPLVLFFGLIYFTVRVFTHKYLILCASHCNKQSTGVKLQKVCFISIITYIFMFQFITSTLIMVNGSPTYISIGGSLSTMFFLIYLILLWKAHTIMKIASGFLFYHKNAHPVYLRAQNPYIHPIEVYEKRQISSFSN